MCGLGHSHGRVFGVVMLSQKQRWWSHLKKSQTLHGITLVFTLEKRRKAKHCTGGHIWKVEKSHCTGGHWQRAKIWGRQRHTGHAMPWLSSAKKHSELCFRRSRHIIKWNHELSLLLPLPSTTKLWCLSQDMRSYLPTPVHISHYRHYRQ